MISRLLFNVNNLIYYLFMLFILCILVYLIYKIFLIENDLYMINDKIYKLEMENGQCNIPKNKLTTDLNVNEFIMNQIFDDNEPVENIDIIEINDDQPEIKIEEPIFDLKKEVIMDDKESIMSTSNSNKKKLLKLNLDKLKEKCTELGVNTEGTKAQLIEKILEKEKELN
jgi:hypothetical protein